MMKFAFTWKLIVGWVLFEVLVPPVSIIQWSSDWGGHWYTQHARRHFEKFGSSSDWQLDIGVLIMEALIVLIAAGVSLVVARKADREVATCRILASSAAVLHTSVILLPFCSVGSDTVWLINPFLLAIGSVFLGPNVIMFLCAKELAKERPKPWIFKGWVIPFQITISVLWTVLLVVAATMNSALGGWFLGTLALWLTTAARRSTAPQCETIPCS